VKIDRAILRPSLLERRTKKTRAPASWRSVPVTELFNMRRGCFHAIDRLDAGEHPTISRAGIDNGFVGSYERPDGAKLWPARTITVSSVTGDAFVQPVPFMATDNVVLCTLKKDLGTIPPSCLFFLQLMLNQMTWRYSYGRQCYKTKFATTEVVLPIDGEGGINWKYMSSAVENTEYWPLIEAVIA